MRRKRFSSFAVAVKMMRRWIEIGVKFFQALVDRPTARPQPTACSEVAVDTAAEDLRSAPNNTAIQPDNPVNPDAESSSVQKGIERRAEITVQRENEVRIETEGSPTQEELKRRREIVRRFFSDFWTSADEKPATFAERLNQAQGYINERLTAHGETWLLDHATRKQLGLPPAKHF